ncbi:hypothetical protein niasHT_006848 [Heterodera trifolii]|uniref:Uncharacterized protein n=2 Tax=Heterodera trifolii TaxID=157864 RepID=A0ABD2KZD6_9BILA
MCEQLSTHIGPDAGAFVLHRKRRITHVPYWWVNNPTLGEFCFAMIGRADIEGSKSDVAMDAWPPQASYPCGPCGAHETPQEPRCFTGATSLSQAEPLPGTHTLNQKRELWLGLHTTSASSFALPRKTALANRHFPSLAISLEYLLLPPRSALVEAPAGPTPKTFNATTTTLLHVMARLRDKHVYKPMTSDDRFARQNRFGLPPEFPLASSCSGIVHHLSGLSAYALSPPHRMRSRRDYVAPQHRSARDHTSAPRVEQMTGFYTENAQLRARAGPNWLLVRVARDRHRPSARANTDPKPLHNSPRVNSTPPIRVPDPERLASRPSSRSYSEHLSALRLQMPHSPLNRRTANPSLEASSPTYSNKRVNADQIRQLCPFPPHRFHVLFNSLFKVLCNFPSRHVKMGRRRQLDRSCTFSGAPVKGNLNKRANPSSRSIRYTSQPQRSCDSALDSSQFTRRYYGNPRRKIKAGMPVSQALRHSMRRTGAPELRSVKRELEPQVRASTPKPHSRAEQVNAFYGNDPEPGVPMDVTPMAQCAFECFVFKVSAVRTNYRSWLRSSSIHEPSDPPIRLEFILQQKCQARALPRRLITATDVAASTNTPLVTARKTGNETTIPSQCVMCLPQQPLNDAQTPAQPLGRPTSVHTPLAQRTNQARRPATDTLPHSSHPQAFTCAALSGTPAPTYGSTPKAWLVRQLPRNVGQRPQVISNDLCPSADGGIWWCQRSPNRTAGSLHTDRSRNTNRPRISRNGSVPGSDGRCVQRAGTYSERVDDSPLQGIPRSRTIIAMSDPNHGKFSPVYQPLSGKDKHADFASVARVQPRTSKGITDLLLLNFVRLNTENPSKKLCPQKQ